MKLRECYVFTRVCDSVPGGVSQHASPPGRHPPDRHPPLGRHNPGQTPPLGRHPPGQTPPWADTSTVNERAVRILLEYILVRNSI